MLSSRAIFISKDPSTVQTEIGIDIPVEARNEHITEFPGYEKLRETLEYYVHNLNIESEDENASVEFDPKREIEGV